MFFACARNSDEYFIKSIPNKFLIFPCFIFYCTLLAKSSKRNKYLCKCNPLSMCDLILGVGGTFGSVSDETMCPRACYFRKVKLEDYVS